MLKALDVLILDPITRAANEVLWDAGLAIRALKRVEPSPANGPRLMQGILGIEDLILRTPARLNPFERETLAVPRQGSLIRNWLRVRALALGSLRAKA